MNIAISGASGFIGSALSSFLEIKGHKVIPLGRKYFIDGSDFLYNELSNCDVIINLAGATINKRWTEDYKKEILSSRINATRKIVNAIARIPDKPRLFISTSAVGCYPIDIESDEDSPTESSNFLASVCREWELEAGKSKACRNVICRFGVVLSPSGGALKQILLSLKFKMAVKFSSGNSPFPWISLNDLINAIYFIISNESINGIVNCVSPEIISYNKIICYLKHSFHAIISITIPSYIKRTIFGEMGSVITGGQRVIPRKLLSMGFKYQHPSIDNFIKENYPLP